MAGEVRRFMLAVIGHWQGLATGGLITALVLVYVVVSGQQLARWFYLVLFLAIFLPMSCFLAWRDQARVARLLDDRDAQQEKAAEYAPRLQAGRKIVVKWMNVGPALPPIMDAADYIEKYDVQRAAAFAWLDDVKADLEADFGPDVAVRFNLGKPVGVALGVSEPEEHQARVLFLETLIGQMRDGSLHLRVGRAPKIQG